MPLGHLIVLEKLLKLNLTWIMHDLAKYNIQKYIN